MLPFDSPLGRPDAFGRRIARNTSHLLIDESHVATVADPAGGAYAVEKLTDDLAVAAWELFGRLEDGAGPGRRDRRRPSSERDREIATRKRPLTGLTEFPNLAETLPEREPAPESREVRRYGAAFEALRDDPPAGHVFLATHGHGRRAHRARDVRRATCSPPVASPSTSPAPPRPPTTWSRRTTGSRSSASPAATAPTTRGPTRPSRALRDGRRASGWSSPARPRDTRRRLCGDGRRRPGVPDPDQGEAGMSVPKSFAGLPLSDACGRAVSADSDADAAEPWLSPEGIDILPGLRPRAPRGPGRARHLARAARRSCAAPTRRCTRPSRGRSGSTPASPPPRSPTRSTAATSRPARRASASPSTWPPTAATTPTTRGCAATSAWPAWRSTRSTTPARSSTASRSTRCRCR